MIRKIFKFLGIDFSLMFKNIKGIPRFLRDIIKIKKQNKKEEFGNINYYPILIDKNNLAGTMSGHYFHQDLLVAQKIFSDNPSKHVDIGSRIDGFISHLATFRKVEVFDIRALNSNVDNILFKQVDLMGDIPIDYINYTDSISSLHVIEHFGLGRYGDKIDINGHIKGLENIKKILKNNGKFYFSVPIGNQRIEFNAHRVFSLEYILNILKKDYLLINFSYIDDNGDLYKNIKLDDNSIKNNFNHKFGCGVFELIKKDI